MKAFPTTKPLDSWDDPNQGMDLRDYFGAKAMQAIVPIGVENSLSVELVAKESYKLADAMMEARKQ
jgi:hypothetical protein